MDRLGTWLVLAAGMVMLLLFGFLPLASFLAPTDAEAKARWSDGIGDVFAGGLVLAVSLGFLGSRLRNRSG